MPLHVQCQVIRTGETPEERTQEEDLSFGCGNILQDCWKLFIRDESRLTRRPKNHLNLPNISAFEDEASRISLVVLWLHPKKLRFEHLSTVATTVKPRKHSTFTISQCCVDTYRWPLARGQRHRFSHDGCLRSSLLNRLPAPLAASLIQTPSGCRSTIPSILTSRSNLLSSSSLTSTSFHRPTREPHSSLYLTCHGCKEICIYKEDLC